MGNTGGPIRKNRRALLAVMVIGVVVLTLAGSSCGGDSRGSEPEDEFQQPIPADTIEDAQGLVDFPVAVPAHVPPQLAFKRAWVDHPGQYPSVMLTYGLAETSDAERSGLDDLGVIVNQSAADVGMGGYPSIPVQVQGTTGFLIRGEDIDNPGLVVVQWRKDDISFYAYTFPDERFTEEEFLRFLNSLEPVDQED